MANELTLSISASFAKSSILFNKAFSGQVTVSGTYPIATAQNIGTSDETLDLGAVATAGYLVLKNRDATNYITLGEDGSSYPIKLKAGEFAIVRWNGAAVHAKANTAACDLEYLLIPD
jgi:hypothetical protein